MTEFIRAVNDIWSLAAVAIIALAWIAVEMSRRYGWLAPPKPSNGVLSTHTKEDIDDMIRTELAQHIIHCPNAEKIEAQIKTLSQRLDIQMAEQRDRLDTILLRLTERK